MTPAVPICRLCGEPVLPERSPEALVSARKDAKPAHLSCVVRALFGGVNHIKKSCICYGGWAPADEAGVSKFDAAKSAHNAYRIFGGEPSLKRNCDPNVVGEVLPLYNDGSDVEEIAEIEAIIKQNGFH